MTREREILSAEQSFLKMRSEAIHQRISDRAYFKAEKRGFAPGHALDDWLEAEDEVLTDEAITHNEPEE